MILNINFLDEKIGKYFIVCGLSKSLWSNGNDRDLIGFKISVLFRADFVLLRLIRLYSQLWHRLWIVGSCLWSWAERRRVMLIQLLISHFYLFFTSFYEISLSFFTPYSCFSMEFYLRRDQIFFLVSIFRRLFFTITWDDFMIWTSRWCYRLHCWRSILLIFS